MDSADSLRTESDQDSTFKSEKTFEQIEFEILLNKIKSTKRLSIFCNYYVEQKDSSVFKQGARNVSDRIRKQIQRSQKEAFGEHLKFLKRYCEEKKIISCSSTLDFVIESLHPDQKIAREISEFLSGLGDKINNS